ncbi:MAG: hypothetical protein HY074_17595 [Deltaproteobacteria bacterium]|nr:hypothetical protein [Deltaproteobacteria bacterium]
MTSSLKLCAKCVLPSTFPNITFDQESVCNFCRKQETIDYRKFDATQKLEFDETLQRNKGVYQYDAICCYSGGKDSTYMLKMMIQDMGLNVLAYTLDNGFITEQSKQNIKKVTTALSVDHVFYSPSPAFMKKMYVESMLGELNKNRGSYKTRISDACLSCISLVNTHAARMALQMRIPMIFAGFTPGQIPRAVIKNGYRHYKETWETQKDHFMKTLGSEADRFLNLREDGMDICQMSPFLVYEKSEKEILDSIRSLGWIYPENLDGCSSNCALNAVGNLCHEKKFGFHPYAFELSQLIRKNLLDRDEALAKLSANVNDQSLEETLEKLGLSRADLEKLASPRP